MPDEFVPPDFAADLDVEACIARCPASATAKGMFLSGAAEMGRRAAPSRQEEIFSGLVRQRWTPFLDYSLRDNMRIMVNVTRLRWPRETVREGLRRVGWTAYPTFAESMAGRVILGVVNKDLEAKFSVVTRGFSLSVSHARVTPRRIGDRHWQLEYVDVYCFLDSYHVGILEGVVRTHGLVPDIRIQLTSPESGTMDLRW